MESLPWIKDSMNGPLYGNRRRYIRIYGKNGFSKDRCKREDDKGTCIDGRRSCFLGENFNCATKAVHVAIERFFSLCVA